MHGLTLTPALLLLAPLIFAADPPVPGSLNHPYSVHPAFRLELFASEPQVLDPVALCFDAKGRLYVAEMADYPLGIGPDRKAGGRVRLLEDVDGDGRCDRSSLFAEGLSFPTSVTPWKEGVIVAAPPEILYLADTNSDGRADVKEVWYRGFTRGVTDSNLNGLRWGPDARIHGVNGGNSGSIRDARGTASVAVPLKKLDFAFDPKSGLFETTYFSAEGFGLVFDDWGRSFSTYNIDHIQQRILPAYVLGRYPGLPPLHATESISDHEPMSKIFPLSEPETRPNHPEQSGRFSSAGGMGYLGSDAFPPGLRGSVLVCDVVGHIVHRDVLTVDGPIFKASRDPLESTNEFFASADPAFRPVGLELGPDNALYLIDMQRDVIEHPDYIPEKVKQKQDLMAGSERGRIYRLVLRREADSSKMAPRNLQALSTTELTELLSAGNQTVRHTAQRLLRERWSAQVQSRLKQVVLDLDAPPLQRALAALLLMAEGQLSSGDVISLLQANDPNLREVAASLAQKMMANESVFHAVIALAADPDPRVRLQVALALGGRSEAASSAALTLIFKRDMAHRWTRVAVLSSLPDSEVKLLLMAYRDQQVGPEIRDRALREIGDWIAGRSRAAVSAALLFLNDESLRDESGLVAVLEGLEKGASRRKEPLPESSRVQEILSQWGAGKSLQVTRAAGLLARRLGVEFVIPTEVITREQANLMDPGLNRTVADRKAALDFLVLANPEMTRPVFLSLLRLEIPLELQEAALQALLDQKDKNLGSEFTARWREVSPALWTKLTQALVDRAAHHDALLTALEKEQILPGELNLDLEQRRRLLRFTPSNISSRAKKFFSDEEFAKRSQIIEEWLPKLPRQGTASAGREVFKKICASCHRKDEEGFAVGPDLSDMAHRSLEDLVTNILDPNLGINPAYAAIQIELNDGESETGILKGETDGAVTVVQSQGVVRTIPRASIRKISASKTSLMPVGLEQGMTPKDLRDLVAYLQNHNK